MVTAALVCLGIVIFACIITICCAIVHQNPYEKKLEDKYQEEWLKTLN